MKYKRVAAILIIMAMTVVCVSDAGSVSGSDACAMNAAKAQGPEICASDAIPGSYIVKAENEACTDAVAAGLLNEFGNNVQLETCGSFVFLSFNGNDCCGLSPDEIIARAQSIGNVSFCEQDSQVSALGTTDDTYTDSQWSLNNSGSYRSIIGTTSGIVNSTNDIDIDAPEGWELFGEKVADPLEVIVAVIDTGVDYKHRELRDEMWKNPNEIPGDGIDNDKNGYIDDVYGWDFYNNDSTVCHYEYNSALKLDLSSHRDCDDHGTHVAGIIAATANNKVGIAGAASNIDVKIMSLKVHGGQNRSGSISNAIKAIAYAQRNGAKIINMSWGTYEWSESLYTAIKECGLLFVTAAGNDGTDNDIAPMYPASFDLDNILSVSYVDSNGALTGGSNFGKKAVDIVMPSVDIYSTIVGSYGSMSGSSMAAAHATALAAELYSVTDGLYAQNVREVILESVKPVKALEGFVAAPGIPSMKLAAENIDKLVRDKILPTMKSKRTFEKSNIVLSIEAVDDVSGINQVRYLYGRQGVADFQNGTKGTAVEDGKIVIAKSGTYCVYVRDNAMNERAFNVIVSDDKISPEISYSYKVSFNRKKITVTVNANDLQSGVKAVKYLDGKQDTAQFLKTSAGNTIETVDGKGKFTVDAEGIYTLYAADYRGNKTVLEADIEIIPSESLKLGRKSKTMYVGKTYKISPVMEPENTTDALKYTSSNPKVATVNKYGKITALKEGKTTITVKTASGLKKKLKVTVKKKPKK